MGTPWLAPHFFSPPCSSFVGLGASSVKAEWKRGRLPRPSPCPSPFRAPIGQIRSLDRSHLLLLLFRPLYAHISKRKELPSFSLKSRHTPSDTRERREEFTNFYSYSHSRMTKDASKSDCVEYFQLLPQQEGNDALYLRDRE